MFCFAFIFSLCFVLFSCLVLCFVLYFSLFCFCSLFFVFVLFACLFVCLFVFSYTCLGPVTAQAQGKNTSLKESNVYSWSRNQVQEWFEEVQLPQLKSSLNFANGKVLVKLYEKYKMHQENFEKEFHEHYKLTYVDTLRLCSALEDLIGHIGILKVSAMILQINKYLQ